MIASDRLAETSVQLQLLHVLLIWTLVQLWDFLVDHVGDYEILSRVDKSR
jgi:hypothetical protein